MKTTYTSVQIIASVIGSVSRKAMYLVQPESFDGSKIYKNTWIPVQWKDNNEDVRIDWEEYSQSYVELPMSKVTPSMLIDLHDNRNVSNVKHRIVNGKDQAYLALERRILLHVPTWMMRNFEIKYKRQDIPADDLFHNDDEFYGVAESQADHLNKGLREYQEDRAASTYSLQFLDTEVSSIEQWERDNPEYLSYE